ncbi:urease accessory protein UreD [Maribius pontilimi]|uniref:Urease accessory protein UreD n=2 Tax=Palleronia pontilimi TaxID=1964209 RepID=A0A934IIX9_9RHOB|nr:urease accessory protein UreD [Palleronia pontilimi]
MTHAFLASSKATAAPRSLGALKLSTKRVGERSAIDRFRTSGSTKVAFPRRADAVEAIVLNTAGGLTGGDRFELSAQAGPGSHLVVTTQAAERAYRSQSGVARIRTHLSVADGAVLHWLPQELIVFDGASIDRQLDVDLDPGATLVLVESMVFGRRAMGETVTQGRVRDTIAIRRNDAPIYWDRVDLGGNIAERLARPALGAGLGALATVLCCGPHAEACLPRIRALLPETGGASLVADDVLSIRLLAEDSFLLRRALVPVLEVLTATHLPKSWSL